MYVIKSDGSKQEFDVKKLEKQVNFIIKNTPVTVEEFLEKVNIPLKSGLTTKSLQFKLVDTATKNVSPEEPHWNLIAGRAEMWKLYRDVYKHTKFTIDNWIEHMEYLVSIGQYKKEVITKLKELDIKVDDIKYGIKDNIYDINPDYNLTLPQVKMLESKYIIKDYDTPIEYPFMIDIANAVLLADTKEEFFKILVYFALGYISLATPFFRNLRRPNGNTISCFIGVNGDFSAGIYKAWADIANISAEGGGVGWYIGKYRPGGTATNNVLVANPITKWTKIKNDIIISFNQRGARSGSLTLAYEWWQTDIYDFLEIKSEMGGDLREKAFDIFPQVIVNKFFARKALAKEEVYLFNHFEVNKVLNVDMTEVLDDKFEYYYNQIVENIENGNLKHYKKVKANELWKKTLETWIEIGDMYIVNIDGLNFANYVKDSKDKDKQGITQCGNLCVESFSILKEPKNWVETIKDGKRTITETDGMYHSCNLLSINVAKMVEAIEQDWVDLMDIAVKILDKSIELGTNPSKDGQNTSEALRNIGIGMVGGADYMAYHGKMYDTEDGQLFLQALSEKLAYHAYSASINLAKELGSYPWFNKDNYSKIIGRTPDELNEYSKLNGNNYDWNIIQQDIYKYGIRNFYLLAYAPNTSTGVKMGVSASYLPVHNKFNYQTLSDMVVPILPYYIKDRYWNYKTKYQYNPIDIIKVTEMLQVFVDTGISMEMNLNPELTTIDKISEAFLNGFINDRLKAVYYSSTIDGCVDCAN